MTLASDLLAGRREAEKLMTTSVAIGTTDGVLDEGTGGYTDTFVPAWTGKAKIHTSSVAVTETAGVGQVFAKQSLVLSLPITGTESIVAQMEVHVTVNPLDSALVGAEYRITGTSAQTYATARRFEIERIS